MILITLSKAPMIKISLAAIKKKATNLWLLVTRRNRVDGHFEIKEKAAKKNKIVSYFRIKQEMESANGDLSNVSFFIEE